MTAVGEAFVEIRPQVNRSKFSSDLNKALSGQEIERVGTNAGRTVGKGIEDETDKASARAGSKMESRFNTATTKVGKSFGSLGGLLEQQFGLPFAGVLDTIGSKIESVETKGKGLGGIFADIGKGAVIGGVAAFAVVAGEGIHLADQFEEAHARLEGAVHNVGDAFEKEAPKIAAVDKKLELLGFTNIETEGSLATLTRASGSTEKALGLMGLAADLARARHISLDSAVGILSKVVTGHVALLGRYGIATKDAAGNTLTVDEAVKALSDRFGGQAQKSAETFQGKVGVLKAELTDVGVKIGLFLIPWIEKLVGAIQDTIKWFEKHKTIAEALAITLGVVLVAAAAAWAASMVVAAFTSIVAMAPVLLAIAVIGLAVADGILLWQRFGGAIETAINDTIIPAINLFIDGMNTIIDALNAIPLLGLNIHHVGHVGELGGGGGGGSGNAGGGGGGPFTSGPLGSGSPGGGGPFTSGPLGDGSPDRFAGLDFLNHMSAGGFVKGTGNRDTVPTMLTPGEYVMSRSEVAAARKGGHTFNIYTNASVDRPEKLIREMQREAQSAMHLAGAW